ncbi:hypothetical protein [Catenulispora pinisilvae]|uniref:hypothetical protein n=1 Tax=Catenulispora pinisilvae TaxID=2705253 RepID=UPI00189131A7|nr:hypothetical protein [Catenulispora pinisilvae]
MLLALTGSSGAGKSTLAFAVADRLTGAAVHDFDEVGVPDPPIPPHWRNEMTEHWIRRALEYQERGLDLVLTGNSPLGEILAAPSAPLLDGIAVCLIDVADEPRRGRLARRDGGRWDERALDSFCGWAAWQREHARDPRARPAVIADDSWPEMVWSRWTGWASDDPRWRTEVIDTTGRPLAASADRFERWVAEQRAAHRSGRLPLAPGWADAGWADIE